jgi:SAM-dependent methyltransferase
MASEWTWIQGFDLDDEKVAAAGQAAARLGDAAGSRAIAFQAGDLRSFDFPLADTVFAFDVLHYLSGDDQRAVVAQLSGCLAPGGRLLIRETNQDGGIGAGLAASFERVGKWLGINRGVTLDFRQPGALEADLRAAGLTVEKRAPQGALQNVLLIATRSA